MPRIRTIKPQFWLDENLGKLPRDVRLLYIGLWNLCDDTGVFEYRPERIKVQLFPYDIDLTGDTVLSWLEQLCKTGDVLKFGSNGYSYGFIPTFSKHQEIKKPSKWTYAKIPSELLTRPPLVSHQSLTSTPPVENQSPTIISHTTKHNDVEQNQVGEESPTSNPPVPLGSRLEGVGNRSIGSRLEGVGDDTKNKFSKMYEIYEQEYHQPVTPKIAEELRDIYEEYGLEIFEAATKKAAMNNKRFLSYIRPILEDYKSNGIPNKQNYKETNSGKRKGNPSQFKDGEQLEKELREFNDEHN